MANIGIIVGSVYGNAQNAAEEAQTFLANQGHEVEVHVDPDISLLNDHDGFLVVTSTTGVGDVPPNLELFYADAKDTLPSISGKKFAVIALGDSSYGESYCGAGKQMFELMSELQGSAITDLVEIDAMETFEPEADVLTWLEEHHNRF
ncbi:MAG: flavodoxin domain-containing protein [Glaciecola sp.]|jgi:flavodoxin|nr:flavodoxin domain-containing protein [Glaciecola sp.]MDG1816325.1 flavodoxin domain-containing protein [Glaciecola sp.]MDG2100237.1 flavodoxin domain-containing protein [Glaciecola sp.]